MSFFQPFVPLTIINLPISPSVYALPLGFTSHKVAEVTVAIRKSLKCFPLPQILMPSALILSSIVIDHNAFTLPHAFLLQAKVLSVL